MEYTSIPDQEAATLLSMSKNTIRNAVMRGDLTRVPMAGQIQHVAREQVILFTGTKQIRRSLLSKDAYTRWEEIESSILHKEVPVSRQQSTAPSFSLLDQNALAYMHEKGLSIQAETPQGSVSFRSVTPDENEKAMTFVLGTALLLGLGLFFAGKIFKKDQLVDIADNLIATIGIAAKDLQTSEGLLYAKKQIVAHPQEATQLVDVFEEVGIPVRELVA